MNGDNDNKARLHLSESDWEALTTAYRLLRQIIVRHGIHEDTLRAEIWDDAAIHRLYEELAGMGVPARAITPLMSGVRKGRFRSVDDIAEASDSELLNLRGMGQKSFSKLRDIIPRK